MQFSVDVVYAAGLDCPAVSDCGGLAVVDMACVEADIQRKSELIQSKTAVLNDKERELRLLEQQLVARERVISWQERHFDVKRSLKHAPAAPPALESVGYYQNLEDSVGQQTEKYRGHVNAQLQHHAPPALNHRQRVLPPDGGVHGSSTGWPMEKLEEQFARLAQTATTDVLPRQMRMYAQESADIKSRPPDMIPFHPVDQYFNHQNCPTRQFSSAARRRGRPKGSRNRYSMKMPPAVGGLPVYGQLMRNLYTHAQLLQHNPVVTSAAKGAVQHNLPQQMMVNCRPPGNAAMMAESCRSMAKVFTGGPLVPNEQPRRESFTDARLSGVPTQPVLLSQGPVQSTAVPAAMAPTVQQLLASTAFTTGASILPPLSPVPAAEFDAAAADDADHELISEESFHCGRNSGDRDPGKDVAYRVVDDTGIASDRPPKPAQAVFTDRTMRYPPEVHQRHLSDQVLPHNVMVPEYDGVKCDPAVVQCRGDRSHILPKVSSFDTGQCWSSGREEALHRDRELSNHVSTVDDDDDERRLVVVIDGD